MKKLIALILAFAMVFALTACGSSEPETTTAAPTEAATEAPTTAAPTEAPTTVAPTTVAPTTEAPTTEAPTTEAPTTEAPTTEAPTEAPTQSGKVDGDKAEFYAAFKENVGEFNFVGDDIRIIQSTEAGAMVMVTAHNMILAQVTTAENDQFAAMYVDNGKLYVQTVLLEEGAYMPTESWYVADVPAGEDPLGSMSGASTEDYTYEDNMSMEYLETVEVDGVVYDKVKVTTDNEGEDGEAIFWFVEDTVEVWKLEMEQVDDETGVAVTAIMEFFTNDDAVPAYSTTPKEVSYDEATMTFALAMMSLLYGEMEIGD